MPGCCHDATVLKNSLLFKNYSNLNNICENCNARYDPVIEEEARRIIAEAASTQADSVQNKAMEIQQQEWQIEKRYWHT